MFKNSILLLFFLPLFSFAQFVDSSHENYKVYYYENGSISSEGFLEEGKPNGYWITYYPNQLRKSEGNRKNFLLDGEWKFYDEKGNIENSIVYVEDKKTGSYKSFDDNCYLLKKEEYVEDKLEGNTILYWPDSTGEKIKKIIPYNQGRREGTGYEYGKDGRIVAITTYKKNFIVSNEKVNRKDEKGKKQGLWKTYYKNNRLKKEERYKDDVLNGYVKFYNAQGKLESATLYLDGKEQSQEENVADFDITSTYFSDGKVKSTTVYNKAGKKDGISTSYDQEGKIVASEIYRNGYLLKKGVIDDKGLYQGYWEEYYLTGKVKSKGSYKNGKKFGKWEYFFTNGKLEQKGTYDSNGKVSGEWNWFYENGNLLRREEFRRGIEDGYMEEYAQDGAIITKGEYFDGEKEGVWFYELNDHRETGKYRYGEKNGFWEYKHPNGKTSFEGTFLEGTPDGKHKYYNNNGVLIREEYYSYGLKDGKWKWYDANGAEILSITYKDGEEKKVNGQKVKFAEN